MSTSIHEYLDEVIADIMDELDEAQKLVQLAQDATLDATVRRDAVHRLEALGRVDELLQLAKDHAEPDAVRIEATAAVVHLAPQAHLLPRLHKEIGPLLIEWSHDKARIW